VVAIRREFPGISRVEDDRGGGPLVADDWGVGFAAHVDVCAAFPSTRLRALRLFLLFHASVDDHCSVFFRACDSALFAVDTARHLTNRSSQPLAAVMTTFDFMKQFPMFATLAAASGGSAQSR
jgi:hypothetical protein